MKNIISILLTVLLLCALGGTAMAESVETLEEPLPAAVEIEPEQEAAEEPTPAPVEAEPEQAEPEEIIEEELGDGGEDMDILSTAISVDQGELALEGAFSEGNILIVCVIAMAAVTALVVLIAKKRAKG